MLGGGLEGTAELRGTLLAVMRLESLASVCILPPDRAEPPLGAAVLVMGPPGVPVASF